LSQRERFGRGRLIDPGARAGAPRSGEKISRARRIAAPEGLYQGRPSAASA